jgi:hypothetical protein
MYLCQAIFQIICIFFLRLNTPIAPISPIAHIPYTLASYKVNVTHNIKATI